MQLNIYEARTRLSELVDQAHGGETVIIAKSGKPLAKLVPLNEPVRAPIRFGLMRGEFLEADDFDAPLPITWAHAAVVHGLPAHHRDPFDRLLVAQAITEPLHLLTQDAALQVYSPLVRLLPA